MVNKFYGVNYPIFVLKSKPVEIIYSTSKISIKRKTDSHIETLDNKELEGDYFSRLLQIDQRVTFDYTCKDLQSLVMSNAKWGIDSKAIPHDFSIKEEFEIKKAKVRKIRNNYIWVEKISYPFKIDTKEKIDIVDDLYVILVKINHEWVIKEFTYDAIVSRKRVIL